MAQLKIIILALNIIVGGAVVLISIIIGIHFLIQKFKSK